MVDPSQNYVENLSLEGYFCIQTFFILMNKRARNLILLEEVARVKSGATSISSNGGAKYQQYSF